MRFLLSRIRHEVSTTCLRAPLVWYRHHHLTPSDLILAEYPKSGITWVKFLLYELVTGRTAGFAEVNQFFNDYRRAPRILPDLGRLIPTHEVYRREFKQAIYLARDARDVVLSEYAYLKALGLFTRDLDTFIGTFLRGRVNGFGSWQAHVHRWLDAAESGKVRLSLVKYEELRQNPEPTLAAMLDFCGLSADPAAIRSAVRGNSLDRMRQKEDEARQRASADGSKGPLRQMTGKSQEGNRFVRRGKVGEWRERLTPAQIELIDRYAGSALMRLGYPQALRPVPPGNL